MLILTRRVLNFLLVIGLISCGRPARSATAIPSTIPPTAPAAATTASPSTAAPADPSAPAFPDSPLIDLFIAPAGDDSRDGLSRDQALQTISAAWGKIPDGELTTTGYRLNLLPGVYPCEGDCINFFSDKSGSADFPIILQAADGPGTVTLNGGLNLYNVRYLSLLNLSLAAGMEAGAAFGNNVLHIENGDHIFLRGLDLRGPMNCITDACNDIQEVLKVNQSQYVYLENSNLSGAYQTVLDYFSVQYGHILNNHIHRSGGRCAYLKGGSSYFLVANNELDDCREAGFQAGEGSNLAFMRAPWLHYEAYDIKVVNNIFHDIYGAGLSVSGGYNILMAYNTLYRIGLEDEAGRPWALVQLVHGARGCIAADEFGGAGGTAARCQSLLDQGGWGTAAIGEENGGEWIPNRNLLVVNNIFYNPAGSGTRYVHFTVNGPLAPPAQTQNLPNPSATDTGLVIRGNIIWNNLLEGSELVGDNNGSGNIGCQAANPTCNPTQLAADNLINVIEPQLSNPAQGDFRPAPASNLFDHPAGAIASFTWADAPALPAVPPGELNNTILTDRLGLPRSPGSPPGAYTGAPLSEHLFLPLVKRL